MQVIDQVLEIVRRAHARGGREVARGLVAPRSVEGMFHDRQQLHVRKTHVEGVLSEQRCALTVGERSIGLFGDATPRAEVHLVDRHRLLPRIDAGATLHPLVVLPVVTRLPHPRRGGRRHLEEAAQGIGLVEVVTAQARVQAVLVARRLLDARDEALPDAGTLARRQCVVRSIPVVEITHHRHPVGVGGPEREVATGDAVDDHRMTSQVLVEAKVATLVQQVQVVGAEQRGRGRGEATLRVPARDSKRFEGARQGRRRSQFLEAARREPTPVRSFLQGARDVDGRGLSQQVIQLDHDESRVARAEPRVQGGEHVGRLVVKFAFERVRQSATKYLTLIARTFGQQGVELTETLAFVDVLATPPTGEGGGVVGRERRHRTSRYVVQFLWSNRELRDVGSSQSVAAHGLAQVGFDSAQVLTDDVDAESLRLDRDDGQEFLEGHRHVDSLVRRRSLGDKEEPLQSHDVVDAHDTRDAHVEAQRLTEHRVRVDHVMGLQRLFFVPEGASPDEGVYVSMPFKELLAIVAVEAQRLGVDIVGEDLGTVEPDLRQAMRRDGLRRTYVAQFAIGPETLDDVPPGSVASFATHDTATFAGWWSGSDIDERENLGLLDALVAESSRDEREVLRRRLAHALERELDDEPADVLAALHAWLGASDAGLVMVQLDDLLGESSAVNIPGTLHERANWSRLASSSLEELASSTTLARTLEPLRTSRGYAQGRFATPTATLLSANDLHLLNEGRHFRLYQHLGCHPMIVDGVAGCYFALWAPNADRVSVVGDFNDWDGSSDALSPRESSGVWEGFVAGVEQAARYKYRLHSRLGGDDFDKADPLGRFFEVPSATATRVWQSGHDWGDDEWMERRAGVDPRQQPVSVYEVHLGSWRRVPEEANRSLTYRESAPLLAQYALDMGFTHVQLLPVMEHPFYGSWGYQTTGYFAPTSRMGTPDDFKYLVDHLHQRGIGVLLDWVPLHFPADSFALARFDGTHLYEHADVRQRVHPDWLSWTFNYGRNEVRSFLISSACFWLDEFHADGLRLDAVASMLYLDYSRAAGEWVPNRHGGREDLDAVEFLRQCNNEATQSFPGVMMIAEESTSWPAVTGDTEQGGLGFTFKWDLGWMHDTLDYLSRDAVHRRFHQGELTFRAIYAANEHFMLPLSHDEVVHGKGSVLARMAGDEWQKRANLRLLFGYQFTLPGKKLLFMGDEFAQLREWDHENSLDWHLLDSDLHRGVTRWVRRLNDLYRDHAALWL